MFLPFLMEHCLCSILYRAVQPLSLRCFACWHVFVCLHKIVRILIVVNLHFSDGEYCGAFEPAVRMFEPPVAEYYTTSIFKRWFTHLFRSSNGLTSSLCGHDSCTLNTSWFCQTRLPCPLLDIKPDFVRIAFIPLLSRNLNWWLSSPH